MEEQSSTSRGIKCSIQPELQTEMDAIAANLPQITGICSLYNKHSSLPLSRSIVFLLSTIQFLRKFHMHNNGNQLCSFDCRCVPGFFNCRINTGAFLKEAAWSFQLKIH